MTAACIFPEKLAEVAQVLASLPHGSKTGYLKEQAAKLGVSVQTLSRKLAQHTVRSPRKRRCDAGQTALSEADARMISATMLEAMRSNRTKRMMSVHKVLNMLIANNEIDPVRVDKQTGEVFTLSQSTILRALKQYCLHPQQLLQPDPVNALQSLHPNHVWQIDASLCVLFYLPSEKKRGREELTFMDYKEFYKNKPANESKIVRDRVWRYVVTDHASGCIFVWYVFGGENSENLCESFIQAMQPKADRSRHPFCGVPKMVMLDPGSANTSYGFKNLCHQLGVHVQVNKPGNPRSKGQVENANNLVETDFESSLKFMRVHDIAELQGWAGEWMRYYNSTAVLARTESPRFPVWQRIRPEELILPPPADYCRELVLSRPETRKVQPELLISFEGRKFDVRDVPQVLVGETLTIAKNPWQPGAAQVQRFNEHGHEYWIAVPEVVVNEWGFRTDAAIIGQEYKAHADTPAQTNKKALEMLAYGADTLEEAAKKRKQKALPFDGRINPFAHQEQALAANKVVYLTKQGTQMDYNKMEVAEQVLSPTEAAKILKPQLEAAGGEWAGAMAFIRQYHPEGIPAGELDALLGQLMSRGKLRMVKGA